MPKTVADYSDAVERIVDALVPHDATTRREVERALKENGGPQVNDQPEVVRDKIVEMIVTVDRVAAGIEGTGELPTRNELPVAVYRADRYGMEERQESILQELNDNVVTLDDVTETIRSKRPRNRSDIENSLDALEKQFFGADRDDVIETIVSVEDILGDTDLDPETTPEGIFREDVEQRARELSQAQLLSGVEDDETRLSDIAEDASRQIGAPTRESYRRAQLQSFTSTDPVRAIDVVGEDVTEIKGVGDSAANEELLTVRDQTGSIQAVVGGRGPARDAVAEEMGVESMTIEDLEGSTGIQQSDGQAFVTFRGRRVQEVDL